MVDYGELVMKAVSGMLQQFGVTPDGLSAAARKGDDRSLAGKVQGIRAWLSEMHPSTGLQDWDAERLVGLPHYDKSWGTSRNKSMWSPAWSSFHERHIVPLEQEARGKRQKTDEDIGLDDALETLLGDDNGDRRFGGDVIVDGTVYAKSFHAKNADMAEFYKVADGEAVKPRQVIGLQLRTNEERAVSLQTGEAREVGIVSENPAVCGNAHVAAPPMDSSVSVPVVWAGWQGQVWVLVSGSVSVGDVLVPSGRDDGCAVASADGYGRVLGIVEQVDLDRTSALLLMGTERNTERKTPGSSRGSASPTAPPTVTGLDGASWDMCNDAASWPDMSETGRSDAGHSDGRSDGSATLEQLFTSAAEPDALRQAMQQLQQQMQQQMQQQLLQMEQQNRELNQLRAQNVRLSNHLELIKELQRYPNSGTAAKMATRMQSAARRAAAQRQLSLLRAATLGYQRLVRGWLARRAFSKSMAAVSRVQCAWRRALRQARLAMMHRKMASRLQAAQRGLTQRRRYATQRHAINAIQRLMRSYCVRFLHNPQRTKTSLQRELQRHQADAARLAEEKVRLTAENAQERAKNAELMNAAELAKKELAESRSARTHFLSTYRSMHGVFPPILEVSGGMLPQAANVRDDSTCFLVSIGDWAQRKGFFYSDTYTFKHLGFDWCLQVPSPGRYYPDRTQQLSVNLVNKTGGNPKLQLAVLREISIGVLNMQSAEKTVSQSKLVKEIPRSQTVYSYYNNILERRRVDEFISNTGALVLFVSFAPEVPQAGARQQVCLSSEIEEIDGSTYGSEVDDYDSSY